MKLKLIKTYVVGFILIFGESWHHNAVRDNPDLNGSSAFVCAIFWPLYLSYRFFEP